MTWQLSEGDWCHIEIPSKDREASRRFYEQVFGWTFMEIPGFDAYMIQTSPDGIESTIGSLGQNEGIVSFVLVKGDMDERLRQVEAAGGSVVKPTESAEGVGSWAYVKDPEGHVFGFWKDWPSEESTHPPTTR